MKLVRRRLGFGTLQLEVTEHTLRYDKATLSRRHTFEAPLSEISLTVERWSGYGVSNYLCAAMCVILLISHITTEFDFAPGSLGVAFAIIGAMLYFFVQARVRSDSYSIVRSTRETSRDIWILRSGAESEVDAFLAYLLERVKLLKQAPSKAVEPTA